MKYLFFGFVIALIHLWAAIYTLLSMLWHFDFRHPVVQYEAMLEVVTKSEPLQLFTVWIMGIIVILFII